jgi:hypothetical protein
VPIVVDDPEIGKPGDCKIESWAFVARNTDFLGVTSPACVANLGRPVEFSFSPARFRSGEWGPELLFKAKTNIGRDRQDRACTQRRSGVRSLDRGAFCEPHQPPTTFPIAEQFKIT